MRVRPRARRAPALTGRHARGVRLHCDGTRVARGRAVRRWVPHDDHVRAASASGGRVRGRRLRLDTRRHGDRLRRNRRRAVAACPRRAVRPGGSSSRRRRARPRRRPCRPTARASPTSSTAATSPWPRSRRTARGRSACRARPTSASTRCGRPTASSSRGTSGTSRTCRGTAAASWCGPADADGPAVVVAGGDDVAVQQPRFSPDGTHARVPVRPGRLAEPVGRVARGQGPPARSWPRTTSTATRRGAMASVRSRGRPTGARSRSRRNEAGFGRLCVGRRRRPGRREVARGVHGGLSWVGDRIAAIRSGARTPTAVVVYFGRRRGPSLARGPVGGFEELDLPEPETGDVGGRRRRHRPRPAVPAGAERDGVEPAPMLVWIHGGPTGQWAGDVHAAAGLLPRSGVGHAWCPTTAGPPATGARTPRRCAGRWGELDVSDIAAGMRAAGGVGLGRRPPDGADRRVGRRVHRAQPAGAPSRAVRGRRRPVRRRRPPRPERDHPPLRGALPPLDRGTAARSGRPLPGAVARVGGRAHRSAAARPAGRRRRGGAARAVAVDRAAPARRSAAPSSCKMLRRARGTAGTAPRRSCDELATIESFLRRHVLEWRAP